MDSTTNSSSCSDEEEHCDENDRLCGRRRRGHVPTALPNTTTTTPRLRRNPRLPGSRHNNPHHHHHSLVAWCLRGIGMVGMTVLNPLCSVLAMNYASPSILAPFSGLTLVWIVLWSYPVIGERPSPNQVIAASLIVLGEVIVAIFGDHTNDVGVSIRAVKHSYRYPPFILYFVGLFIWMSLLFRWMKIAPSKSTWHRFAWGVSGGSVTGLQNFLKDGLTVLKASSSSSATSHQQQPLPWLFFLLLALAGASAFGGLLLLTACMKRYDATYSSAMFVGSFVVSASIMSAVHYQTFQHLAGVVDYILYPVGLFVLMGGVYLLVVESKRSSSSLLSQNLIGGDAAIVLARDDHDDDDHDDDEDEEGAVRVSRHVGIRRILPPSSPSRRPLVSTSESSLS